MEGRAVIRRIRCRRLLGCVLAACSVSAGACAAADADAARYVALGDSYTSAPMAGPTANGVPGSCFQSTDNYPHLVAAAIHASLTDVSCSGAVIANMAEQQSTVLGANPPQLDALTPSTTLVTIGISANDAGYFGVADDCLVVDLLQPTGSACEDQYTVGGADLVTQTIDQIAPKLAAEYQSIHARAPRARVLAVGYPALMPVNGTSCWPLLPISPGDVSWLTSLLVQLDMMIATTAAANDVQYVDTYTPTIGHDVCQPIGRAGFTGALPTSGLTPALHPNALGEQLMAEAVVRAIHNPAVVVPLARATARPDLKLTRTALGRSSLTASGTISRAYRGNIAISFRARYRGHTIVLRGRSKVARGRFHATTRIPDDSRGGLAAGVLTATSHAESGLAAGTARARMR